jgi:hypothetical protein
MHPARGSSEPSNAELLLIAIFAAPVVGWAAMAAAWFFVVNTALRGGPDLGVVFAGSLVAAAVTAAYATLHRVSPAKLICWPLAAFLLTFAVAAAIVIPLSAADWFEFD